MAEAAAAVAGAAAALQPAAAISGWAAAVSPMTTGCRCGRTGSRTGSRNFALRKPLLGAPAAANLPCGSRQVRGRLPVHGDREPVRLPLEGSAAAVFLGRGSRCGSRLPRGPLPSVRSTITASYTPAASCSRQAGEPSNPRGIFIVSKTEP